MSGESLIATIKTNKQVIKKDFRVPMLKPQGSARYDLIFSLQKALPEYQFDTVMYSWRAVDRLNGGISQADPVIVRPKSDLNLWTDAQLKHIIKDQKDPIAPLKLVYELNLRRGFACVVCQSENVEWVDMERLETFCSGTCWQEKVSQDL